MSALKLERFGSFEVTSDSDVYGEFKVSVSDCALAPDDDGLEERQRQFIEDAIREKLEREKAGSQ